MAKRTKGKFMAFLALILLIIFYMFPKTYLDICQEVADQYTKYYIGSMDNSD